MELSVVVAYGGEEWLGIRSKACPISQTAPGKPPPVPADAGQDGIEVTKEEIAHRSAPVD